MDELIAIIVRAIIDLLSGSSGKKLPPPQNLPTIPPIDRNLPRVLTPQQRQALARQEQARREQLRQQQMRQRQTQPQQAQRSGQRRQPPKLPAQMPAIPAQPAIAKQAAAPSQAARAAAAAPPPKPAQATLSATSVRQLLLGRRTTMRTIFVLSEIVGPPAAMK